MRLENLTLHIGGEEVVMRFHDRLTVVSGIGAAERAEMAELLVGALAGTFPHPTDVTYVDSSGCRAVHSCDGRGGTTTVYEDGSPAPDLVRNLGLDADALSKVVRVAASDLGLLDTDISAPATGELGEARNRLAVLNRDVQHALDARARVEALRDRLGEIDAEIRASRESEGKRRFARILVDLERVRAEAAVLRGGAESAEADRRLIAAAAPVHELADEWRQAADRVNDLTERMGGRERMDRRSLEQALAAPAELPPGLEEMAAALHRAESERDELARLLAAEATDHLPEPSHPGVARLARLDQDLVWEMNQRVLDAALRVEQASLQLGGLEAEGLAPAIVSELEQAHNEVEQSEQALQERRGKTVAATAGGLVAAAGALAALPVVAPVGLAGAAGAAAWGLVSPKRRLARALAREEDALTKAGAPTYLSFHMRRIDATLDRDARAALEEAAAEHRRAQTEWASISEGLSALEAIEVEDEIRGYAEALAALEQDRSEIEAMHRRLAHELEPAVSDARRALLEAIRPYGIDDPTAAVQAATEAAMRATIARLQVELEEAELAEEQVSEKLMARLAELGFDEGDVGSRVGGFDWALGAAQERARARSAARPPAVVAAELARLEDLARTENRAEWGSSVTKDDAEGPDEDALQRERAQVAASYAAACRELPELDVLVDRRNALERRVRVLEAESGDSAGPVVEAGDLEPQLLARLAGARRPGTADETLFLVLDEPFAKVRGEGKWAALDMVERLGSQVQMLYLSDDPDVVAWARRRVAVGAVTLMEPVAEPA